MNEYYVKVEVIVTVEAENTTDAAGRAFNEVCNGLNECAVLDYGEMHVETLQEA